MRESFGLVENFVGGLPEGFLGFGCSGRAGDFGVDGVLAVGGEELRGGGADEGVAV